MEPKEKYEQLLEEQSQKLKRELNKYETMINIANILRMSKINTRTYIEKLVRASKDVPTFISSTYF